MTQVEWLRKRRDRIQRMLDELAHMSMAAASNHEQYLVRVGRYQQLKALIAWFDQEAKKIMGGEQDGDTSDIGVTDMDDDDFEPPRPTRQPAPRPTRARTPRQWSG